tara:strand:+ start:137 stop:316 length:180 start_codon:yes stop_codon:yes gene_type:complete
MVQLINIGEKKDELTKQMYKELKNELAAIRERLQKIEEDNKKTPDKKITKLIKKFKGED